MIDVDDILKHKSNFYFVSYNFSQRLYGDTECSRGKSLEKLIFTTKLTSDMIAAVVSLCLDSHMVSRGAKDSSQDSLRKEILFTGSCRFHRCSTAFRDSGRL